MLSSIEPVEEYVCKVFRVVWSQVYYLTIRFKWLAFIYATSFLLPSFAYKKRGHEGEKTGVLVKKVGMILKSRNNLELFKALNMISVDGNDIFGV